MDYNFIGLDQLGLSAAALHTTARELTQIIYSLAAQPGYTSILRQEIFDVLAHSADNLTLESINMLWKMDSFMKETIRMQGPVLVFHRKALCPITLSGGTYLPPNSSISVPRSAIAYYPAYFSSPDIFDGLRFSTLRSPSPPQENKHQFVSIDSKNTYFGAGTRV